jgi:CRP-like cAMP-binding protein
MRTERPTRKFQPKVEARFLASQIVCVDLDRLLPNQSKAAARIINQLPAPNSLKAGETIRLHDPHLAILIRQGAVDVVLPSADSEIPVKRIEAGSVYGEMPLLGLETLGTRAVAAADCEIVTFDQDTLRAIILKSPEFALRAIEMLSSRLVEAGVDLAVQRFGTNDSKLIQLLLKLAGGNEAIEDVSQRDLAYMLGTSRQAVSRGLGRLRRQGLVETSRMRIKLLNPNKTTNT